MNEELKELIFNENLWTEVQKEIDQQIINDLIKKFNEIAGPSETQPKNVKN